MILFLASDFFPHIGGKSTHICDLRAGLEENNHATTVYSQTNLSIIYRNMLKIFLMPLKCINSSLYYYYYNCIWQKIIEKNVMKIIENNNIECISVQDAMAASALKKIRKKIKCPIILTMHTYFGLENSLDCEKISKIDKIIYEKNINKELESLIVVDKIIAVDNRIKKHVESTIKAQKIKEKININIKKCISIENFTNIEKFKPLKDRDKKSELRKKYNIPQDSKVICCARRLVEKNGVEYAVKAMSKVSNKIKLVIAGDGPQFSKIKKIIIEKKLEDRVILIGAVDSNVILELYQLSDISIVPSITVNGLQEATSISAIEAMACGLPTIASNIGGLKQIIKNKNNGILCDEKNISQISEAILELQDKELYDYISQNARDYIIKNHSHLKASEIYYNEFCHV